MIPLGSERQKSLCFTPLLQVLQSLCAPDARVVFRNWTRLLTPKNRSCGLWCYFFYICSSLLSHTVVTACCCWSGCIGSLCSVAIPSFWGSKAMRDQHLGSSILGAAGRRACARSRSSVHWLKGSHGKSISHSLLLTQSVALLNGQRFGSCHHWFRAYQNLGVSLFPAVSQDSGQAFLLNGPLTSHLTLFVRFTCLGFSLNSSLAYTVETAVQSIGHRRPFCWTKLQCR